MVESSPRRLSVASVKGCLEDEERKPSVRQHEAIRKTESAPPSRTYSPSGSRWKKLRTTVQLGGAVTSAHRRAPLKREDSFLQRFSTRPPNISAEDPKRSTEDLRCVNRFVLNPDESLLFGWLWLLTACGLYNSWTLIVRQAFPELRRGYGLAQLWAALDWGSDMVYLLDIVAQFRTGYLEQGIMVRDSRRLARHYLASKDFFLDVASMLPLSYLQDLGDSPMLRFPRFLKARRIYRFYYAVESRTAYPNLWRVANLIHVLLLLAHWFGCFYYMLSELEGFQGEWAYKHPEKENSPLVRKYLGSVYWSTLTLTTIGDLATPATNLQYLFTIISYLIGVFIFATIVGQVGNVITNRNASRLEFERLLDGAKLYMRHHRVPKGMQRRVQRWYDYSWSRGRMQGGGDIHSALGILPDKLKTELAIHVNLKTLKKVSIFQECQPEFLHDLVLKMKAYIFTPGDLVCRKGEVAREMFIIADGILQVINEQGQVLTQMKAGDFFGEIGILNLDGFNRRTADVRSVGYSELFSLSREDVLAAMKDYPEAEEILQSMGRRRLMEARVGHPREEHEPDCDDSGDNMQKKKGLNLTWFLKYWKEAEVPNVGGETKPNPKDPEASKLVLSGNKADRKIYDDSSSESGISSVVGQLTSKLRGPSKRKKARRGLWTKLSGFIRRKRATHLQEPTPTKNRSKILRTISSTSQPQPQPPQQEDDPTQSFERRSSLQPSKPTISNWNRSEMLTHSEGDVRPTPTPLVAVGHRRKTLADGSLHFHRDIVPLASQKSVPAILMTGSGVNGTRLDKKETESPVKAPVKEPENKPRDKPLTPKKLSRGNTITVCEENPVRQKSVDVAPVDIVPELFSSTMQEYASRIVQDFKKTMDTYIAETHKDMCQKIKHLEEEMRQKDATIAELQSEYDKKFGVVAPKTEEEEPRKEVANTSANRPSQDSAICISIDFASPTETPISDTDFKEEDLWLVEFPQNALTLPNQLRRHSSVEVGHELPFHVAAKKPTQDPFLAPAAPEMVQSSDTLKVNLPSPRRFSESHARPDVIPLNKSFAARVRRVFAKVKASRAEEESKWSYLSEQQPTTLTSKPSLRRSSTGSTGDKSLRLQFPFPTQQQRGGKPQKGAVSTAVVDFGKTFLPTITESCSFDSLREVSPVPPPTPSPVRSMPSLDQEDVIIDITNQSD